MFLADFLLLYLRLIFSVAFITLFERKFLGYVQQRKGPNKPSLKGLATPAADAFKLIFKERYHPFSSSWGLYFLSPLVSMFLFLLVLRVLPFKEIGGWGKMSLVFLVAVLRWNVYPLFFRGWGSNRIYRFLGGIRGIAQSISYEISLAFLAISLVCPLARLNLRRLRGEEYLFAMCIALVPVIVLFLYSAVAETNRAPFDFSERESELVSGFNIEYGGIKFALIFLAEYGIILFLSILISSFLGTLNSLRLTGFITVLVPIILWVWIRGTFPRYRYDFLIQVSWKCVLPMSLGFCYYILATYFRWAF